MLYLNTINFATQNLLTLLQQKSYLQNFALAGGTCLALHFGHRRSIDLFSTSAFEPLQILEQLQQDFQQLNFTGSNKYMLFSFINNVKTDLIFHPFTLLSPTEIIEDIRMFSLKDIAAMKLFAITKRGSKKDFFDVYQLMKIYSIKEMVDFFSAKYGYENLWLMQNSILYFEDAETENDPELLSKDLNWNKVKKTITESFKNISF